MKKLIAVVLAAITMTGCSSSDTDAPLGNGTEHSIERLSFNTSLHVSEYVGSLTVDDSEYDGIIEIHCMDLSEMPPDESIPTLREQYEGKISIAASIADLKPEYSFTTEVTEKEITIDGVPADSLTAEACLYRPECGYSRYFIEAARLELDGKLYGISYCYDTMRDDLSYTYDPERAFTDITSIKQRALTMYDFIGIK